MQQCFVFLCRWLEGPRRCSLPPTPPHLLLPNSHQVCLFDYRALIRFADLCCILHYNTLLCRMSLSTFHQDSPFPLLHHLCCSPTVIRFVFLIHFADLCCILHTLYTLLSYVGCCYRPSLYFVTQETPPISLLTEELKETRELCQGLLDCQCAFEEFVREKLNAIAESVNELLIMSPISPSIRT